MTTVIIKTSKGVAVMNCRNIEDVDGSIEKLKSDLVARGISYISHRIDDSFVNTTDRTFRNDLEDDGVSVKVNMTKARATHLNRLREKRTPILTALDVEWSKAMAQKNQALADQVEAKRQALRDMPQTVKAALDAAKTPDELKAIVPLILTGQ